MIKNEKIIACFVPLKKICEKLRNENKQLKK